MRKIVSYLLSLSDLPGMKGRVSASEGGVADRINKMKKEIWHKSDDLDKPMD